MRRPWWLGLLLFALIAAAPSLSDSDTLERNRQRLEQVRAADLPRYRRLLHDLGEFFRLPAQRQEQLRDLDARLHSGDAAVQARRWGVLERYNAWLDGLTEENRRRVLDAPSSEQRLAVIHELRQEEWLQRQPTAIRTEVGKLSGASRAQRIAQLRDEERKRIALWERGSGTSGRLRPTQIADLPPDLRQFVTDDLMPILKEDLDLLKKAEGKWPDYPKAILDLTERYLVHRPLDSIGALKDLNHKNLSPELKKALSKGKREMFLLPPWSLVLGRAKGHWPEFAVTLTDACRKMKISLPPLGAAKLTQFPVKTQVFVQAALYPRLSAAQKQELIALEGKWPEYPRRLAELARQQGLVIPGMMAPAAPDVWDGLRDQ